MDDFLSSFSLIAFAEMGDKTQLLAIILAARCKCFWPIFWGMFLATLLNHTASAYIGSLAAEHTSSTILEYSIAIIFVLLGLWLLKPDKSPTDIEAKPKYGYFVTTLVLFFLAEMGDKTQLATITLGAHYKDTISVILGTTLGMLAVNTPAILFGEKIIKMIPLKFVRMIASALFIGFGIYTLAGY